ncbi:MAG: hypothetical protein GC145_14425 [Caulobacter sp.]|nr:hypothetical protein [Caulobacter sp.]
MKIKTLKSRAKRAGRSEAPVRAGGLVRAYYNAEAEPQPWAFTFVHLVGETSRSVTEDDAAELIA